MTATLANPSGWSNFSLARTKQILFTMFFLALATTARAAEEVIADASQAASGAIVPSAAVLGVIAIITGFLFCFFGTSMWRFTIFVSGFYIFATLALTIMLNIEAATSAGTFGNNRDWILLGVSFVVGFIGGYIALCFYKLGVCLVGAVGGFFLSMWILSMALTGIISSGIGRSIFIIVLMIIGAVLTLKFEKHVVIIGTAIAGSYLLVFGVDCFINSGFRQAAYMFLGGSTKETVAAFVKDGAYTKPGQVYALIVTMAVLAVLGAVVQYKRYRSFGKN